MIEEQPVEPVGASFHQWVRKAAEFARRQPTQVLGAACAAGVLLNIVPAKVVARSVLGAASSLGRPALLALGVLKLFELACAKERINPGG